MTIDKYISDKFRKYGVKMAESDLLGIVLGLGLSEEDCLTDENLGKVNVGIAKFIPELLLRPTSVGEGGFSMTWDINGVKEYYSYLCKTYGLKDVLSNKPKVTFL
jgi:hypothetical protein